MPASEDELARAEVENVLLANCGACHGSILGAEAQGGIGFIEDVDELVERGYIVPLNSAVSRIVRVMRDGSMPPTSSGLPPVSEADIQVVERYIDEPRFWSQVPITPGVDAGTETPVADAGADAGG